MAIFTHLDYSLRVYDGTPVTPRYIEITHYQFSSFPGKPERPATEVRAGGEKVVAGNVVTVITDEKVIFNPIPWQLQFDLDPDKVWQLDACGNPRNLATWNVGTTPDVWVPQPVADIGTRKNSKDAAIACPGPKDTEQINGMVRFEAKLLTPADATAGVDYVHLMKGVVNTNYAWQAEAGNIRFTLDFLIFGEIDGTQADFTTGTETT